MKPILTSLLIMLSLSLFAQFSGGYDPANWTTTNTGCASGSVDASGAPSSVAITGAEVPGGCGASLITYSNSGGYCGTICFDWAFSTSDCDGPSFDPFGYMVNGVGTQLTDNGGSNNQSGTTCVTVNPGDVFAFYIFSVDTYCGSATTVVSNFSGPDAVCYDDEGNAKVELCHNGRTICVAAASVDAHLAHGDVLGACCDNGGALQTITENQSSMETNQQQSIELRTSGKLQLQALAMNERPTQFKQVNVYPNPASDVVNLTFNRAEGPVELSVYNLKGQLMQQISANVTKGEDFQLNTSALHEGIYEIRVLFPNGRTITEKLTIGSSRN